MDDSTLDYMKTTNRSAEQLEYMNQYLQLNGLKRN